MKKKKKYGQHFLKNETTAIRIANLIDKYQITHNVLEVGPGAGALTRHLAEKDINLKCVEIDVEAVDYLTQHNIINDEQIIQGSFLKLELHELFGGEPFVLIGNFPYNISSQIVFKALEHHEQIEAVIGMFQKEVADRIVSIHGNKQYGVISVFAQRLYQAKREFTLAPGAFIPPPKVQSAVITLEKKQLPLGVKNEKAFRSIVKLSFGQRRKKLRNTLKGYLTEQNESWEIWHKRPEQLSVEEFVSLSNQLSEDN